MKRLTVFFFLFVIAFAGLSCQLPTQPTALVVNTKLQVQLHDMAGNPLVGSRTTLYRIENLEGVTPVSVDEAGSTYQFAMNVPIIGEKYMLVSYAPAQTTLTKYTPKTDTIRFLLPCHDTAIVVSFEKTDSIPCGTLNLERTLDLGTLCVDHDTTVSLQAGDFVHDCPNPATIASIAVPANMQGLTIQPIFRGKPDRNVSVPASWIAGVPLAIRVSYSSFSNQPIIFDGSDIVVDASPNVKLTIHLKGKGIHCDSCNCPHYDSISFGLAKLRGAVRDTNAMSIGDPVKQTTLDLSAITNGSECDLVFTRIKDFSNPQLRTTSFDGAVGATSGILTPRAALGSMIVEFSALTRGEFVDTARYKIQRMDKAGVLTDCDTLPIIYHGFVGLGICEIDTVATKSKKLPYFANDTITNCINSDQEYRSICIKNVGDGVLRTKLNFAQKDDQFIIRYDETGAIYSGEELTFDTNESRCFSIHFVPNVNRVLTTPPTLQFTNTFQACSIDLPIVGIARYPCVNCLHGSMTFYGATLTSYEGFIAAPDGSLTFKSDKNAKFDVYATAVNATSVTLGTLNSTKFLLLDPSFSFTRTDLTICDDGKASSLGLAQCGKGKATATFITAQPGNLILFETTSGQCGLIYIEDIHTTNGIPVADFEATYPI